MSTSINIQAVLIANMLGIILMAMVLTCGMWSLTNKSQKSRILLAMCMITLSCCIIDPIDFWADGRPGVLYFILVYVGNWLLYFANLVIMPCWLSFLRAHIGISLNKISNAIIHIFNSAGMALLIVNFFTPLVFGVDENNIYYRGPFFWYFTVFELGLMAYSMVLYIMARRLGGLLKFFPVWVFVIPVLCGMTIQSVMYGVSTIWPCIAIAIASIMGSLQNELLFRDKLTGLYNRFYLDKLKDEIGATDKGHFTAMMLDLNGFKNINDTFGHSTGDTALKETAELLRNAVGTWGSTIRYAGDEFVIVLNTQNDEAVNQTIQNIYDGFESFNANSGRPYQLSISIGCCKLDMSKQTVDGLINEIDKLMYENKRDYYRTHDRRHVVTLKEVTDQ